MPILSASAFCESFFFERSFRTFAANRVSRSISTGPLAERPPDAHRPDRGSWRNDGHRPSRALRCAGPQPRSPMAKAIWKLAVGEEAPDFELQATGDGAGKGGPKKKVRLSSYRGKKNVVLAFFPAAFTPV